MRKILFCLLVTSIVSTSYAQVDLVKELSKQAVIIDSLTKVILRKDDSLTILNSNIRENKKLVLAEKEKCEQTLHKVNEITRKQVSESIVNNYNGKPFDDLIISNTKQSVMQVQTSVDDNSEIKKLLVDLEKYYNAKELLHKKIDISQINDAKNILSRINRESVLLDKLKEGIDNYQILNDGLKEMIGKIISLDEREPVVGLSIEIQKIKHTKILGEISFFTFNYDFNFKDYPYLATVFLDILKSKQSNPDEDISYLLKKLN